MGAICEEHGLRDVYTGMTNVYNQAMVEPFRKMQSMPLKQAQLGPEACPTKATRKVGSQLFPIINGLSRPSICPTSESFFFCFLGSIDLVYASPPKKSLRAQSSAS